MTVDKVLADFSRTVESRLASQGADEDVITGNKAVWTQVLFGVETGQFLGTVDWLRSIKLVVLRSIMVGCCVSTSTSWMKRNETLLAGARLGVEQKP